MLLIVSLIESTSIQPWHLPVLPSQLPNSNSLAKFNTTHEYRIPRHLWVAVPDVKEGLNYQLPALFERNPLWEVHVEGNEEKDIFMNTYFQNTSLLWAYHAIHPAAGAAKADIWRYAVLWTYGGVYIDDDSDMKVTLESAIKDNDTLIVAFESNGFNGDVCYIPRFKLSDASTFKNNSTRKNMDIFHSRILLNWALMASPYHPVIKRVMENLVDVIRHEYFYDPVIRHLHAAPRWSLVMCSTGPSLFTASAREIIFENPLGAIQYKLADVDFRDFGGRFKAVRVRVVDNPKHYMNMHKKKSMGLLHDYFEDPLGLRNIVTKEDLQLWEGEAVQSQNGKQIFVIQKSSKRGIQNYDTFLALNFTIADVRVISDERLDSIPTGEPMPLLDYVYPDR